MTVENIENILDEKLASIAQEKFLISIPKPVTASLEEPELVINAENKSKPVISARNDDIDFISALAKSHKIPIDSIHIEYKDGFKNYTYNGYRLFRETARQD